jgi:hypothetical protein
MRLLSLDVEHFRAIQSARLRFGRGLNVVYGPNDHGKSTLTDAIRAALLVAPGTAEARSFQAWEGSPGSFQGWCSGLKVRVPSGGSKRYSARERGSKRDWKNRPMGAFDTSPMPRAGTWRANSESC